MTREETIEAIKVMQAWVDGAIVQYKHGGKWYDCERYDHTNLDFVNLEYRIKSKPLEVWHWIPNNLGEKFNVIGLYTFSDKLECEQIAKHNEWTAGKAVRFIAQED